MFVGAADLAFIPSCVGSQGLVDPVITVHVWTVRHGSLLRIATKMVLLSGIKVKVHMKKQKSAPTSGAPTTITINPRDSSSEVHLRQDISLNAIAFRAPYKNGKVKPCHES